MGTNLAPVLLSFFLQKKETRPEDEVEWIQNYLIKKHLLDSATLNKVSKIKIPKHTDQYQETSKIY